MQKPKTASKGHIKQSKLWLFNIQIIQPTEYGQVPGQQELSNSKSSFTPKATDMNPSLQGDTA